ncbi:transposase IS3 family [Escherichia coli]|nr:transposase IS3 family [Escherichia coli]SQS29574.1 transposase IS3 family [Escherichia coli]
MMSSIRFFVIFSARGTKIRGDIAIYSAGITALTPVPLFKRLLSAAFDPSVHGKAGGGVKESIRHKPRFSDVQKQVAVEHYLNHGCCLAFTSRTLGYPCGDVLARRVNELYASCIGHHDAGSLRGSTPPAYAFIHHHAPPLVEGRVHYISPVSAPVI